jgi:bacteriocin biosynthesis cyclodehydratase domain-containing protein
MEQNEADSPIKSRHPSRLWVSPATTSAPLGVDRTLLWIGGIRQIVEGRSARLIPKLLAQLRDGELAEVAIAAVAEADGCSTDEVARVLEVLWERGLVDEADGTSDDSADPGNEIAAQNRYLSLFTSRPQRAHAALSGSTVDLFVIPELTTRLRELLTASGIARVRPHASAPATFEMPEGPHPFTGGHAAVVVARSLEEDWVLPCNDALVNDGRGFIAATVSGGGARIGPCVIPRESACLRCVLEAERRLVPRLPEGIVLPAAPPAATEPVALLDLVAALITLEVVKSLTGLFLPSLANRQLLIEPASLAIESEALVKLPRCPSCGRAVRHAESEAFDTMTSLPAPAQHPES